MYLCDRNVRITMTGLEEASQLAKEIHQKSDELMGLLQRFDLLRVELGIKLSPASNKEKPTSTDQT